MLGLSKVSPSLLKVLSLLLLASSVLPLEAARKPHVVLLGAARRVAYSKVGDPAGARGEERELHVRALIVDGAVKEWTTGEAHDVTDRSFVIRRALRLNDTLPGEHGKGERWVWQRGPWLLVDRTSGHVSLVKLPEYDPAVSQVSWFRDYAAYCGVTTSGKALHAVVAQIAGRKPLLNKKLMIFDGERQGTGCTAPPEWQRAPLRVNFHPAGREEQSFGLVPGSAVLEESGDEEEPPVVTIPARQ